MTVLISIKDVVKSYPLGETVVAALRGITLEVRRGEFAAIIGPSGSGKSTLFNLLGCIDSQDSGSIMFDGLDVQKLTEHQRSQLRNRKIGFIFQSFNLVLVLSVFENIELPLLIQKHISKEERRQRVLKVIEDVGLKEFANQLPSRLSGGQRQRVAIARALVSSPDLVLADEPTANLDSVTTHNIIDLMLELNQKYNVTFLFSTHDEKLMGRVNRIIRLKDGITQE